MPSSGFVIVWGCFCTDAADDPADLTESCPGHGRHRIGDVIENLREGAVRLGHICRETECQPALTSSGVPDNQHQTTTQEPQT